MKTAYKIFKIGKTTVSGAIELGQLRYIVGVALLVMTPFAAGADNSSLQGSGMGLLQNKWLKAGINSSSGTLGSGGNTSPGVLFDPTGTGTFDPAFDYLTPGSPFDGLSVKVNGTNFTNNNAFGTGISATSFTDGEDSITWTGDFTAGDSNWSIESVYSLSNGRTYIDVVTSITAGSDAASVYFAKFMDPDSQGMPGDTSATDNVLGYSGIPSTNLVLAEANVSKYAMGLYSTNTNVTAGVNNWSSEADSYNGTIYPDGQLYGKSDSTVGLSFSWTEVAAGDVLTASYSTVLGPNAFKAVSEAVAGGAGGGTPGELPAGWTLEDVGSATDAASNPEPDPVTRDITEEGEAVSNLISAGGALLNNVFDGGELVLDQDVDEGDVPSFSVKSDTGNAKLRVNGVGVYSLASQLTDADGSAGIVEKTGPGTLRLTNTSSDYSGGTVVSEGVLEVASNAVLGAASGSLTLNGGTLAITATMSSDRELFLGANDGTLSQAAGTVHTVSGVVSGTGSLTKTGAGVLTVTGTNTYTGGTTVSDGTLDLDGSLTSSVSVASTGRIEGVGSSSGGLTSSGTVAPGNSPGTLSFAGSVAFAPGNTFVTELDGLTYSAAGGAGSYDRLAVTGDTATLTAGGTLSPMLRGISAPANNNFVPIIGDTFRIVTTVNASGVSGAFSAVTDPAADMPANTRFDVLYGGNYVDLVLTPADLGTFAQAYGIGNMISAANALDTVRPAQGTNGAADKDQFFNGLYGLTETQLAQALIQVSGEIHAFALSDARDGWQSGLNVVRSASQNTERHYWVDASSSNLAVDKDSIGSSYDGKTGRLWVGTDFYQTDAYVLGIAVGMSNSNIMTAATGSADIQTSSLAVYMNGSHGAFEYGGILSVNRSEIDTTRAVGLSTGASTNRSSSTARGAALAAQIGYRYDIKDAGISSLVWLRGDVDTTQSDSFTEIGSAVTALNIAKQDMRSADLSIGYTISSEIKNADQTSGRWNLGIGASKTTDKEMPYVMRTMSLHGATWNASVPQSGAVAKFASAGIDLWLGEDATITFSLAAYERNGSFAKSAAFGLQVQW